MERKVKAKPDKQIMAQVANLYYISEYTQEQIAKEFDISRSSVSEILSEARKAGIVEIRIKEPGKNNTTLAEKLTNRFDLERCFVMPTGELSRSDLLKKVAQQGAMITAQELKSHSVLGVAWGATCYECMVSFKNLKNLSDVQVVPLIGGTNRISSEFQLNEMVRIMAEKLKGTPTFINAPALVDNMEEKQLFMKSIDMKWLAGKWKNLDIALIGVGGPPEYYESETEYDRITSKELYYDSPFRAVGNICGRRYNIYGQFLQNDYNERILGIDEKELRKTPVIICIAAGTHKVLSILGALNCKIISYLIIDEITANSLLEIADL
jgi:DNA-binding transcriptional regulator LsrR (DeoR family)